MGLGPIRWTAIRNPAELPHKELGVDIALECTGFFTKKDTAKAHLEAGAKRVLVSAPCDGADKTIVFGVNHHTLTDDDVVVSNGSCTTNCLAPVARVLLDTVGIERGYMTTVHAYTNDQHTLGPAAQRPLPGPRGGGVDDPDLDRRGEGDRPRHSRTHRQARRRARSACRPRTSR